jgi:hypothetical protein
MKILLIYPRSEDGIGPDKKKKVWAVSYFDHFLNFFVLSYNQIPVKLLLNTGLKLFSIFLFSYASNLYKK